MSKLGIWSITISATFVLVLAMMTSTSNVYAVYSDCEREIDNDDSLTYAQKLIAKKECDKKSAGVSTTNSQDCLGELGISFQKQNTDLFIVNHWAVPTYTKNVNVGIMGDIVNLSEYPLTDIVISIKTFNEGEMLEDTTLWHPVKKILRPGESSPFVIVPSLSAYDGYEMWISNYELSCKNVVEPHSSIKNIIFDVSSNGRETVTVVCEPTVATRELSDIHMFFVAYNEDNFIDSLAVDSFDSDECFSKGHVTDNLSQGRASQLHEINSFPIPYDYVKNERYEIFTIEGPPSIMFNERDIRLQILEPQKNAHSKYYPDSLLPKFMDIEEIRKLAQQDGSMRWTWSSPPLTFKNIENISVPEWIKNNAKWWADGQIGDSDFTSGIQHLMKEKIINIPNLPEQASEVDKEKVPDWIKNNAGWWADGLISEEDFLNGIKYLVEKGIIRV